MEYQSEQRQLQEYASAVNTKILASQSDLDPKDRAMPEMLAWCRRQQSLVVLQSGAILTNLPSARAVQNCKIVMINKGLTPGQLFPATSKLIAFLLENAEEAAQTNQLEITVSAQQQRLRELVKNALSLGASDIHIEVRHEIARIRLRKHGELFLHAEWLPKLAREVVSVAFNKETDHAVTHFNPLVPQNASMLLDVDNREVRLRLASLPAHEGYDVVLRILTTDDTQVAQSLESLGYFPDQIALFEKAIHLPYGAVIMSGPTGSGKTTTLASCMQLVDARRKVFTIEDPVEKLVQQVTQVPVNTEHYDRDFASMARTVLRMDPDVIVLGEMRDEDTAAVMMRASITGHLVFSTVHTNSAMGIVTRLLDLGVSSALLATPGVLNCLICQRLVPVLCKSCATPIVDSRRHYKQLMRWEKIYGDKLRFLRARGVKCDECHGLGVSGRTVVAEMIWLDEWGYQFIQRQNLFAWQQYLYQNGWKSYGDRLNDLVIAGKVDPLDAEKLIGPLDKRKDAQRFDYLQ